MAQGAIETAQNSLNGLYKEVYADRIKDLIPESDVFLKGIPFVSKEQREGNKYHQPVLVSYPTGATWGVGAVALSTAIASQMQDAQIQGSAITHRDLLAYDAAAKAANGGKQSFMEATALIVKNLFKAESKFLELDLIYGSGSLSGSNTAGVSLATQTSNAAGSPTTTQTVVTISYATWAAAIFSGMENAIVQFYNAGVLLGSGAGFTIVSLNVVPASATVGGTLTVSGSAPDTTLLQAQSATALDIYWNTQFSNSMLGLKGILTNTTGTVFNISATSYSLWGGNVFDCQSTQLTFGKIQTAVAQGVNRGLEGKVMVAVSPNTFANLVDEQSGARLYDSSYGSDKAENGFKKLEFFSSNGIIEIVPHIFLHQGEALIVPEEETIRLGPVENVTSTLPGMPGEFFVQSQTYAAYELRAYANEAIFVEAPAHSVFVKNITNV